MTSSDGGTWQEHIAPNAISVNNINTNGLGYDIGDTITMTGGGSTYSSPPIVKVTSIGAVSATIVNPGSGGTDGTVYLKTTTSADPNVMVFYGTVSGGILTSIATYNFARISSPLANNASEPMVVDTRYGTNTLTGVVLNIHMYAYAVSLIDGGNFSVFPSTCMVQNTTSGSGSGFTAYMRFGTNGLNFVRSVNYTNNKFLGSGGNDSLTLSVSNDGGDSWNLAALPNLGNASALGFDAAYGQNLHISITGNYTTNSLFLNSGGQGGDPWIPTFLYSQSLTNVNYIVDKFYFTSLYGQILHGSK
jgi:hypothetical protein